ncbi:MAG: phosphoenolpyruvate hydrolase family protein [Gammaproteobacteria bacterium]|nr:phosphoenolpyruvate hydrolase family protein [Gammaproteobacteria bacterium]
MPHTRTSLLEKLRHKVKTHQAIIGAGAGTGISAKSLEAAGVDLMVIYNSGRFRMAGRGSLAGLMPYGDANAIVLDMANEVLPLIKHTPVLAGVCGTDPFRRMDYFLKQIKDLGFAGVQNFPTVGLYDGLFRQNLEETGMGYALEVEMVRKANKLDLLTTPYVFNTEETRQMVEAGADIIVAHMGLTTKGSIGATTALSLPQTIEKTQQIAQTAQQINPDILVLCHGGPIAEPQDAEYVLSHVPSIHGFYGASSMERLPTEIAIQNQAAAFLNIKLTPLTL